MLVVFLGLADLWSASEAQRGSEAHSKKQMADSTLARDASPDSFVGSRY